MKMIVLVCALLSQNAVWAEDGAQFQKSPRAIQVRIAEDYRSIRKPKLEKFKSLDEGKGKRPTQEFERYKNRFQYMQSQAHDLYYHDLATQFRGSIPPFEDVDHKTIYIVNGQSYNRDQLVAKLGVDLDVPAFADEDHEAKDVYFKKLGEAYRKFFEKGYCLYQPLNDAHYQKRNQKIQNLVLNNGSKHGLITRVRQVAEGEPALATPTSAQSQKRECVSIMDFNQTFGNGTTQPKLDCTQSLESKCDVKSQDDLQRAYSPTQALQTILGSSLVAEVPEIPHGITPVTQEFREQMKSTIKNKPENNSAPGQAPSEKETKAGEGK